MSGRPDSRRSEPTAVTLTAAGEPDPSQHPARATTMPGVASEVPAGRPDVRIGFRLDGRYVLEHVIGEGGMGVVYRGRHEVIGKRVAIKILRGDLVHDAEMTDRFHNEARAASSIGNPHIVDVSDFGRLPDGSAYIVMEYLDGKSLVGEIDAYGPMPIRRALHVAKQVARGLAAAHRAGIVHRDLKPDNVMLVARHDDPDFVKVLDFGIAKVSSEAGRITRAGSIFGTPHYMSPEQASGTPVDPRTDVYSLGVMLYEMLSGKLPFDADTPMAILTQHLYKAPPPLRSIAPLVPVGLEAVVLKALSKSAELRYQTMDELTADLERVEREETSSAAAEIAGASSARFEAPPEYFGATPSSRGLAPPRSKRPYIVMGALALAAAAGAAGIVLATRTGGGGEVIAPAPSPASSPAPAPSAADLAPPQPTPSDRSSVQIVTVPSDAHLLVDGRSIGLAPQTLALAPGERVSVRVERQGYVARVVDVDADGPRVDVTLEREKPAGAKTQKGARPGKAQAPATASAAPAPVAPPKRCPPGMQTDPWGHCEKIP